MNKVWEFSGRVEMFRQKEVGTSFPVSSDFALLFLSFYSLNNAFFIPVVAWEGEKEGTGVARRCKGRMRCKSVCVSVCSSPYRVLFVVPVILPSKGGTRERRERSEEGRTQRRPPLSQPVSQSVTPVNTRISPVHFDSLFPRAYCYQTKKRQKTTKGYHVPLFCVFR